MKKYFYQINLILISVLFVMSCEADKGYEYSEIQEKVIVGFDPAYQDYCNINFGANFELNAVECSYYGDYVNAISQATKNQSVPLAVNESISFDPGSKSIMINSLNEILQSQDSDEKSKQEAQKMLSLLNTPDAKALMASAKPIVALAYITDQAKNYHFTLINEAHWNSQHRAFTQSLLKPLWKLGYRYLALETLTHHDSAIQKRGYPIQSTGYYTKDSNFGNLVREALAIGYQLVPYETENGNHGTLRDRDQAQNIYNKTFKNDKQGKVLIHAGYSHILEVGDSSYEPLGYQLKQMVAQDVLTVDQVTMIAYDDASKQHSYYTEATEKFGIDKPTTFLAKESEVIVDPINAFGIDIQVFHPPTKFKNGRPDWKFGADFKAIPLPEEMSKYNGYLIQALFQGESSDAVPVDQFVVTDENVLLLSPGNFELRLIHCNGNQVAECKLEVQ